MTKFTDEYAEQLEKGLKAFAEKFFPQKVMDKFQEKAEKDILENLNLCYGQPIWKYHKAKITMEILYPDTLWICSECAQTLFNSNKLNGRVIFDMDKKNEG